MLKQVRFRADAPFEMDHVQARDSNVNEHWVIKCHQDIPIYESMRSLAD